MSLPMLSKKHCVYALLLTGSGIMGSWILWRLTSKKHRKSFEDQMNHIHEKIGFPQWVPEGNDDVQETLPRPDIGTSPACVLYHTYVSLNSRETCTPNHWHATYWLRLVAVVEQEPIRAIVQHTDTKRYHIMAQLPVEGMLSCGDCFSAQEVFRLQVRDHYAYVVFVPNQDLDGFTALQNAQVAAQSLSIPGGLYRPLLNTPMKSIDREEE